MDKNSFLILWLRYCYYTTLLFQLRFFFDFNIQKKSNKIETKKTPRLHISFFIIRINFLKFKSKKKMLEKNNIFLNFKNKVIKNIESSSKKPNNFSNNLIFVELLDKNNKINENNINDSFFNTTAFDLHYKDNSLFTDRFIHLLKQYLGNPEDFRKKTSSQQRSIAKKVHDLTSEESEWKLLTKKINHESCYIKQLFHNELAKFKIEMLRHFYIKESNKHLNKKFPLAKLQCFFEGYIDFLLKKKPPFLQDLDLKYIKQDYTFLIIKHLNINSLFNLLVKICLKKATDKLYSNAYYRSKSFNTEILKEPFLFVTRTDLLYDLKNSFLIMLINLLLEDLKDKKKIDSSIHIEDLNRYAATMSSDHYLEIQDTEWYLSMVDVIMSIIHIFQTSGVIISEQHIYQERSSLKENIVFGLPNKVVHSIPLSSHLPLIVKPTDLKNNSDVLDITAKINQGVIDLKYSEQAIKALNLSHSKKFRVNTLYREILCEMHEEFEWENNNLFNSQKQKPFTSSTEYINYVDEFKEFARHSGITSLQRHIHKRVLVHVKTQKKPDLGLKHLFYQNLNKICGITTLESRTHSHLHHLIRKLREIKNERQLFLTSIIISKILEGFPIYYSNKLDFRTRMYPWQYLISRTSGNLKHLLMDYTGERLNKDGFINLLKAYFTLVLEIAEKFELFLSKQNIYNKTFLKNLKSFYIENNICLLSINKELPYFILLKFQIEQIFFKGLNQKIHLNVEIDQNASGIVLLALLLKNKALAERCNILSTNKQDIYTYVTKCVKSFIIEKTYTKRNFVEEINTNDSIICNDENDFILTEENGSRIFEFFNQRKPTKYALMCYCYNQAHKSRTDHWVNLWYSIFKEKPNNIEYSVLNSLSLNYHNFINSLFPGIQKQLTIINNILRIIIKRKYKPKIKTLDGCIIRWDYFQSTSRVRSAYNSSTMNHESYKIKITKLDENNQTISEINKHVQAFLPHLIHSIDAAIMRLIIKRIHEKTGYIINHLHDCVLIHPNYVNVFYEVISEIYTSKEMMHLAKNLLFDPMKSDLDSDTLKEVEELEKDFYCNADSFEINDDQFKSYNMYSFEN
jgi:hypothetical protein